MKTQEIDYRKLILQFIGSLTLCDHMGDVGNDIDTVLEISDNDGSTNLRNYLHKLGVTTLYDTPLNCDVE